MHSLVRRAALGTAAALAVASLAACGGSSDSGVSAGSNGVVVTDAWTKATDGPMTGAFGTLSNGGGEDITVTSASSPVAGKVELHETVMVDGAMQMQQIDGGFIIPAGGALTLEPGGNHIMLMGLSQAIKPGDSVEIVLSLSDGGSLTYQAVAKDFAGANESYEPSTGSDGEMNGDMDMDHSGDMDMDQSSDSMN